MQTTPQQSTRLRDMLRNKDVHDESLTELFKGYDWIAANKN